VLSLTLRTEWDTGGDSWRSSVGHTVEMISWVAMDRIVERKRDADADRKDCAGKVLRLDASGLAMTILPGEAALFRHRAGPTFAGAALRAGVVSERDRAAPARNATDFNTD
jgi:hypothetical protein